MEREQTIKIKILDNAIAESRRFIEKAAAAKIRLKNDSMAIFGSKETAAVKRASMDLSNALVEVRR